MASCCGGGDPLATAAGRLDRVETGRLVLRPFADADVPSLAALIGRWEVARYLRGVPHPYYESDGRAWVAQSRAARRDGLGLSYATTRGDDGTLVGGITLGLADGLMGYWLGQPHWGQGYATEMVAAVVGLAFEVLALPEVKAIIAPENTASGKVLVKVGMTRWGERECIFPNLGGRLLAPLYGVTRREWQARHG